MVRNNHRISVLSCNCGIFGHTTYQKSLETFFLNSDHALDIDFTSIVLSDSKHRLLISRLMFKVLGWRWPRSLSDFEEDHDYYRLRSEWLSSLHLKRILKRQLKARGRPSVLHLHTQSIALAMSHWKAWRGPWVVSIDNTAALLGRDNPSKIRTSLRHLKALEKRCFQATNHIVSWTERAAVSVSNDSDVARSKISVIRPTAPPTMFDQFSAKTCEKRYARSSKSPRLLFVGNDFRRKGGPELVAVFRDHLVGKFELEILSNDKLDLPVLPGLWHRRGISHKSKEWNAIFENADIFVLPTREDCLPMAYVEAISAGLPVVGTNVMSVPEIVRNGVNGVTIDLGSATELTQALLNLGASKEMRLKLGLGARAIAEAEFNPRSNGMQLCEVFRNAAYSPI